MVARQFWELDVAGSSPVTRMQAGVVELADTQDLGSCASAWGFKSLHPDHIDTYSKFKDTIFMLLVQIQLGSFLLIDQWVDQKNFVMCLVYRPVV